LNKKTGDDKIDMSFCKLILIDSNYHDDIKDIEDIEDKIKTIIKIQVLNILNNLDEAYSERNFNPILFYPNKIKPKQLDPIDGKTEFIDIILYPIKDKHKFVY
jgi:hypothetical protein